MREANSVVGHLQVLVEAQLTAGPDAAIAVLVAGEILDDGLHLSAVRVSGIDKRNIPADGEFAIGPRRAIAHETVKVRMGDVALELAELHATWPRSLADLRAFELTRRMLREGEPETCCVRTRGHVVAVRVVRVGDPERRHRVVRWDQDILGVLPGGLEVQAVRARSERGEVGRVAGLGRMTLGLDRQVADVLVAGLDAVFEKEAVTDGV